LHDFDPTARSVFGCFVGEATGDFMPVQLRTAAFAQRAGGNYQSSISANSIRMWGARRSLRCPNCRAETLSPAHFAERLRDCSDGDLI
jgi:hypothetical protein